jgi:transcriptional regulator
MYVPASSRVDDFATLAAFIRQHPFATLVTSDSGVPFASHLPILLRQDSSGDAMLVSHMARANPQWQHFASGLEALAIFHGPHAYVSPAWYTVQPAVPTWNYATVHVYGKPRVITEHERVVQLLADTVTTFESPREQPWSGDIPVDYRDKLIAGIVAFEIPVRRIEGKFKLSQNRSAEDVQGVIEALSESVDADGRAIATMMGRL